jgi:hypothetical protein
MQECSTSSYIVAFLFLCMLVALLGSILIMTKMPDWQHPDTVTLALPQAPPDTAEGHNTHRLHMHHLYWVYRTFQ